MIQHELEAKAIEWYRAASCDAATSPQGAASAGDATQSPQLTDAVRARSRRIHVEQKAEEVAAVLDLQFMLYYQHCRCDPSRYVQMLRMFLADDFGGRLRENAPEISSKLISSIQRITALQVLLLTEMLEVESLSVEEAVAWDVKTVESAHELFSDMMQSASSGSRSVPQSRCHCGTLLLVWAVFLTNLGRIRELPQEIVSDESIDMLRRHGYALGGLLFLGAVFDQDPSSSAFYEGISKTQELHFAFLGHEQCIEGYKSVALECLISILTLRRADGM